MPYFLRKLTEKKIKCLLLQFLFWRFKVTSKHPPISQIRLLQCVKLWGILGINTFFYLFELSAPFIQDLHF